MLVFLSLLYPCVIIIVGFVLFKYMEMDSEIVRKTMHILASFWMIFPILCDRESLFGIVLSPFLFVILNYVFIRSGLGEYVGIDSTERHLGLLLLPVSLVIMTCLYYFDILSKRDVLVGMIAMGLGDGIAALVGVAFGRHKYLIWGKFEKSLEGTASMFAMVFLFLLFTKFSLVQAFLISLFSVVVENMTPSDFDNLAVPIFVSLAASVLDYI